VRYGLTGRLNSGLSRLGHWGNVEGALLSPTKSRRRLGAGRRTVTGVYAKIFAPVTVTIKASESGGGGGDAGHGAAAAAAGTRILEPELEAGMG
jgi:hypothetical protein